MLRSKDWFQCIRRYNLSCYSLFFSIMRFSSFLTFSLLVVLPLSVSAQVTLVDSKATLSELGLLIAQYETRIKQLQAENAVLRLEMAKAGISIPLIDLSGSTIPLPTTAPVLDTPQSSSAGTIVVAPSLQTGSSIPMTTLTEITTKYGKDTAGFISRINQDWAGIKSNYSLPANSRLAGYEFIQTGSMDYVFADIIVGTGTVGIYDTKILYQFEKSEYKRKLIGIFDYNPTVLRYVTRTGTNPFGWVTRIFVADPYYSGVVKPFPPMIVSTGSVVVVVPAPSASWSTMTSVSSSASFADITKAYNEKRYLSTISLSNSYLEKNPATQEVLNIRYRTYFIIGKYTESLAELQKVEKIGTLDKQTACNAQVIATYSKNQALVDKYAAICKK